MKQTKNISIAALILASGILLSRVLGYMREMLLSYHYGAGAETDAFYAAFQIPDLLNYFLSGGALSIAFIPLYNKVMAKDGEKAANDLMGTILGTLGFLSVLITIVLCRYAEPLIHLQFADFNAETTALTVKLTRIVLPAQIFFIMGGIIQAVLLAHRHFIAAAVAPLVYNGCIILGGVVLHSTFGIAGFAYGTMVGAILGPFLIPVLYAYKHIPLRARFAPWNKQFLIYFALAAPLMFGQTLLTLDEWYGKWFGATLGEGAVSHISFARRLMQIPIAVIGQAVAAAALPTLSKLWAEGRIEEKNKVLQETLQIGIFLAVVAAGGMLALAKPGVALIYQHGAFTAIDSYTVAGLVAIFAFAIPAWITQQITVRAFYARGDTWRPAILGTVLSLSLIPLYMTLSDTQGIGGIALAGVLGMSLNALVTLLFARKVHQSPKFKTLGNAFVRAVMVVAPASALAWIAQPLLPNVQGLKMDSFLHLTMGGAIFILALLPSIWWFGEVRVRDALRSVFSKLKHA